MSNYAEWLKFNAMHGASSQGGDPAGTAASLVAAHEAKADPHTQYLTTSRADSRYMLLGSVAGGGTVYTVNGKSGTVTLSATDVGADAAGAASSALSTHENSPDPHSQYHNDSRGDARYVRLSVANSANGYLQLDASGKIPASLLTTIASRYVVVPNQTARLALAASVNLTICAQTDNSTIYYLNANADPSVAGNWITGQSSVATGVTSFNGRPGIVTPQTGDYTADQINETSTRKFVSPTEKTLWTSKLDVGSVKTINGKSLIGSGNVSLTNTDVGAAATSHVHAASDISGLFAAINAAIVPGANISTSQSADGKTIISSGTAGSGGSGLYSVIQRSVAANSIQNVPFGVDQTSFSFDAFALKEEANTPSTVAIDTYDTPGVYDKTDGVVIDGLAHQFNGETKLLSSTGSGLYASAFTLSGNTLKLTNTSASVAPDMTSNTAPAGYVASASSVQSASTTTEYFAFDGKLPAQNGSDCWVSAARPTSAAPQWLALKLPYAAPVRTYSITNRNYLYGSSPASWKLQGSNDGSTWTDLHTVTNDKNNTIAAVRTYTLSQTAYYSNYRIYITDNFDTANYVTVAELKFYTPSGKFILQSGVNYYSVNAGALTLITGTITPSVIDSVGTSASGAITVSNLTAPLSVISNDLIYVRSVCSQPSQIVLPKAVTSIKSFTSITSVTVTSAASGTGNIKLAVSRNMADWYSWTGSSWTLIGGLSLNTAGAAKLISQGMSTSVVNTITSAQWAALYSDVSGVLDSIAFAVAIDQPSADVDTASIDSVIMTVSSSAWKLQTPAEVEIRWFRDKVQFKPTVNGNYKFCYQQPM